MTDRDTDSREAQESVSTRRTMTDTLVTQAARRAVEAWDNTVLPRHNDGMMQELMEALRAAAWPDCKHEQRKTTKNFTYGMHWRCETCGAHGEDWWD